MYACAQVNHECLTVFSCCLPIGEAPDISEALDFLFSGSPEFREVFP